MTDAENAMDCPTSTSREGDQVSATWSAGPRNSYVARMLTSRGVWRPSTVVRSARQRNGGPCTAEIEPDGGTGARDEPSPARKVIAVPDAPAHVALKERQRRKSADGVKRSARIVPNGARCRISSSIEESLGDRLALVVLKSIRTWK